MAVPRSLALYEVGSKCLQQFGRDQHVVVPLFHLDERVTKLNHRLLVLYDELVVSFADSEKLVLVARLIVSVKAVPNWNSSLSEVVCDVHDFVEVQLKL